MRRLNYVILASLIAAFASAQAADRVTTSEKTVIKTKNDGTVVTKTVTKTNDGEGNTTTTRTTTTTSSEGGEGSSGGGGASYEGE